MSMCAWFAGGGFLLGYVVGSVAVWLALKR